MARIGLEFKKTALDDTAKQTILRRLGVQIKEMTRVSMVLEEIP